jgi:hypothetical protein
MQAIVSQSARVVTVYPMLRYVCMQAIVSQSAIVVTVYPISVGSGSAHHSVYWHAARCFFY